MVVPLHEADHEPTFGGKAVALGEAIRAGLPVPGGLALGADLVDRVAAGHGEALAEIANRSEEHTSELQSH